MANITKTIKDYKELNQQVKVIQRNIKELNASIAKEIQPGIVKKLQKELKEQQIDLKNTTNQVNILADTLTAELGDSFDKVSDSTGTLRKQLLETRRIMQDLVYAGEQDSDMFRELQAEAVKMQTALDEASRSITNISKNAGISGLGNQVKSLGAAILSLNFDAIILQANNLSASLGKISWKYTIDGIKGTTTAFKNLGKALLTNPIFLIGTVIVALGVAIYKLMKETGLLQVAMESLRNVFDTLMMPINMLINGLKKLTDSLGLTQNAMNDLAKERMDNLVNIADKMEAGVKQHNLYLNNQRTLLQQELDDLEGFSEDVVARRKELQEEINKINIEELDNLVIAAEAHKKVADQAYKDAVELAGGAHKLNEELAKDLVKNQEDASNMLLQIRNQRLNVEYNNDKTLKKIDTDYTTHLIDEAKERNKKLQEFSLDRLKNERLIRDLEIDLIEDEEEQALEKAREYTKRRIEDTNRDATVNRTERNRIIALLEENLQKELLDIETKYREQREAKEKAERERKEIESQRHLDNLKTSLKAHYEYIDNNFNRDPVTGEYIEKTDYEKQVTQIRKRYAELTKQASEYYSDRIERATHVLELEYQMEMELKLLRDEMFKSDPTISNTQKLINNIETYKTILKETGNEYGQFLSLIGDSILTSIEQMNIVLEKEFDSTAEKVLNIASVVGNAISSMISGISTELNQQLQYDLDNLNASTNKRLTDLNDMLANNLITNEEYNNRRMLIEAEANVEETNMRKEAFEDNKKANIANATVSMLSGIITAWATSMQLGPVLGPIIGASLSALIATMGGINISKIKGTQFGGSVNNVSSGNTSINMPSQNNMTQPSFSFFGQANNNNVEDFNNQNTQQEQNINVHSTISVVEIADVMDSLNNSVIYTELGG